MISLVSLYSAFGAAHGLILLSNIGSWFNDIHLILEKMPVSALMVLDQSPYRITAVSIVMDLMSVSDNQKQGHTGE